MPFNQALFWVGLTALGTGMYYLLEPAVKRLYSVGLTVLGALACAYTVYRDSHPELPVIHLWLILLVLTWALLCYAVYMGRFRRSPLKNSVERIEKPSKLVIHWANYRAVENNGEVFQVEDFLRQIISGDSLVIDVENHNFGNSVPRDPLPFKEKRLQVNYSYAGSQPVTTERREHGRLLLPEDSKIIWLQSEVDRLKAESGDWRKQYLEESQRRTNMQNDYADAGNKVLQLERLLSTRPELPISALHVDAMRLSIRLLQFLNELGEPPAPKYTPQQIDDMSSIEMRRLIDRNDGDFIEACEYYKPGKLQLTREGLNSQIIAHCTRLFPWYEKVRARYALEYKEQVEHLRDRFTVFGILDDDTLVSSVQGKDGVNTIRAIAHKLWDMAYKLSEDGVYQ